MNFCTIGDISPHLTPYRDVTDSEMIPSLWQNQWLEGRRKCIYIYKYIYISILKTRQKGTKILVHSD